ncbi:MAG: hypothetical protein NT154_35315 [Verrucomicrobia bacterium]|nr:hypothetical protein [Verrucomicrobiota bacterium]
MTDAGNYLCGVTSSVDQSISLHATLRVGVTPELAINFYADMNLTGTVGLHYRVDYAEAPSPDTWLTLTNIAALPSSPFFVLDPHAVHIRVAITGLCCCRNGLAPTPPVACRQTSPNRAGPSRMVA